MTAALLVLALLAPATGPAVGETVASVQIEAPGLDAERFTRYVDLKAGQPVTTEAIRHAVDLLHATGELEDVVVEARRTPGGLELIFRLVPAPLLGAIRAEGDAVATPRFLRRVTRLREREPLWPPRLERAARDAALALAEQGYLEARVTAAARGMTSRADAVFTVDSGPLARVGHATLEGVEPGLEILLKGLPRPRPGEVFERSRSRRAAETLRKRLVELGRWRATVDVREAYDPASARVSLAFRVEAGPVASVEFRGARPSGPLRRQIETLLRDGSLKGDVLEEATERLEEDLHRRGYREASVSHGEEARAGGQVAVLRAEAGPLAQVASVAIVGDEAAARGAVLGVRAGEPLQDRLVQEDVRSLTRALEEEGYAEARVDPDVPEAGGAIPVVFRIRAGPRSVITAFDVEFPSPSPQEIAPSELRLRVGDPYRIRDLARDRTDLLSAYRNAGFLQAEVTPEVAFSAERSEARVRLRVSPGPRTVIGRIVIAGLEATREEVIRRELTFSEGEPLGLQKVLESQRRLGALGILERVSISEMDPEALERRSLVVTAEEAPRTTVAYGIGSAERDPLRASAEVTRRNLSGMDRSLSTFVRASFRGNRFLATYREPYLFGRKQDLFVTGFREEDDRETFDFVRLGGLVQTARSLSTPWSLILRYTFQQTDVFNIQVPLDELDRQFRSSTFSGPSASLVNDTRDDPLEPRRGRFLGADVQLSHRVLGGDSFIKGFLQAASYERLSAHVLLALGARLGLARTFGLGEPLRLPLPDRFFAGGDYSLRGYRLDTAGPLERSSTGTLVPTGGNALLLGGAELRVDAGRFVSVAAFAGAGGVYPLVSGMNLRGLLPTAGVGLRYKSALGPLRIDWGFKLNRRPGEGPSRFHFTIGHAF